MKKITVGIPRGLLFYYDSNLWITFFEELGIQTIISENTTKKTLKIGESKSIDEACLSLKIYLGHVEELIGHCDYIFIPRLFSIKKKEQVCTNFNCLYDLVHNLYSEANLIFYNIDLQHRNSERKAYIELGRELGFSVIESMEAYAKAKRKFLEDSKEKFLKQKEKLTSPKMKVLLAGHPYNLYDSYVSGSVVKFLEHQDLEIIYSDILDLDLVDYECMGFSKDVHWTHSKRLLAGIHYYAPFVDGIILFSSFPCGPDSLTTEMLKGKLTCPILQLVVESESSETGVMTRLESFFDILQIKREVSHEANH